ncbi:helix-turn-helix transcriptional regulator [Paenibacillus sp. CC-CFT747]|nr:helix-turn-helix transcriptional regulator [Paenibacillus sp. CC-CFT747]
MEKEIDQDISLHAIAGRFFINSSYLSRLFKHEVGETFSDYVVKRKMLRAKQHLQDGSKVQDAAQKVGYTNVGYFSKLFQRYWGFSPVKLNKDSRQGAVEVGISDKPGPKDAGLSFVLVHKVISRTGDVIAVI